MTFIKFDDKTHVYRRNYYKAHYNPYKKKVYYLKCKLKNKIDLEQDNTYNSIIEYKDKYEYLFKKDCELKCASL